MRRETWRSDLWMSYKIQEALAHNKSCVILCRSLKEMNRLKKLFKNVPVKVKKASKKFGGRGFGTIIIDEHLK